MLISKRRIFSIIYLGLGIVTLLPSLAYAACTSPAAPSGRIDYTSSATEQVFKYCNGTDWVPWAGEPVTGASPPQYSSGSLLANSIFEVHLTAVNGATDEYCLTYETTTGDFEWQTCGAGGATALSGLTNGTAVRTLNSANFAQEWNWSTLSTQNALSLSANAVTSGRILFVSSASTAFTGTMADVALTGNNAANTGTVIKSTVSGGSSAAVPLMVTNLGTGLSLRVNDETGDTDSTPFIVDASGNVGIGQTSANVALDVIGDIEYTGIITDVSDIRLKENIRPLQSPLVKLTSLNGFAFEMKGDPNHRVEYGVAAQDVQKVFPELVHEVRADGTLGVAYDGLIAPMIESIKELKAENEALRARLDAIELERREQIREQ